MNCLEDLEARSQNEIKYDNMVLCELRNGKSFEQALQIAAAKHPDETWLIRGDEDLASLKKHYIHLGGYSEITNNPQNA